VPTNNVKAFTPENKNINVYDGRDDLYAMHHSYRQPTSSTLTAFFDKFLTYFLEADWTKQLYDFRLGLRESSFLLLEYSLLK